MDREGGDTANRKAVAMQARSSQLERERDQTHERVEAMQREIDQLRSSRSVRFGQTVRRFLISSTFGRQRANIEKRAALIAGTALFDETWYCLNYSDVASEDGAGVRHYIMSGAHEARAPNVLFDPEWYARAARIPRRQTALEHYLATPIDERGDVHPLFDRAWYAAQNPDVVAAELDPVEHFLLTGGQEGRSPHPDFNARWYLMRNPDVAKAGLNPLVHYLTIGHAEGRDPNPDFSGDGYLKANPDVAEAGINPLVHFVVSGREEGRQVGPT